MTEKISVYMVVFYTLEHAQKYILNKYNNAYNVMTRKSVRKQGKLPGIFLCRFLTNIDDWHFTYGCPFGRYLAETAEGSPGF